MYVKIEPTGCCEKDGMVQVRLSMYLDPGDARYNEHYVQVPVWPEGGYPGKMNADGTPANQIQYDKWYAALPLAWQLNTFHNHMIYVEPTVTDVEITDKAKSFLTEAYAKWSASATIDCKNLPIPKPTINPARVTACNAKVADITSRLASVVVQ